MQSKLTGIRRSRIRLAISLLPLAFALVGFLLYYNGDVFYALFSSLRVYVASFDASYTGMQEWAATHPQGLAVLMRVCLELGRWLGIAVAATFVTKLLKEAWRRETVRRNALRRDAVALHGSQRYKRLLAESIHERSLTDDLPEIFDARRHVLVFDNDAELFQYLTAHFGQLLPPALPAAMPRSIYLCLTAPLQTHYDNRGFIINNMAEDCARVYWHKLYVRRHSSSPDQRIVVIGFGRYGQALLKQALLINLFADQANMEYHIFGDSEAYKRQHPGLTGFATVNESQLGKDAVFFHPEPWQESLPLLLSADRILLADDAEENNLLALAHLRENNAAVRVHLRLSDLRLAEAFWPGRRVAEYDYNADICVFGTDQSLYTRRIVMDEALILAAKCINAKYMRRAAKGKCASCHYPATLAECAQRCDALDADWQSLSHFLQEANLSQADHIPVKLRQMLQQDCELSAQTLADYALRYEQVQREGSMKPYFELEHARWMRHHYYYNWSYAPNRDDAHLRHPLMVPYDDLPDIQKPKDSDPYAIIPEVGAVVMQAFS